VGWKTWSAFALVLGAGVAVFAFLPRWVSEHPVESLEPVEAAQDLSEAPPSIEAPEIVETPAEPGEPVPAPVAEPPALFVPPSEVAPRPPDDSEEEFAAAMTEALSALRHEDLTTAREAFERAKSHRPEAPEVARGIAQVEEALRTRAIAGHRDRALEQERLESWRAAEAEYDSALALDSTLRFAQEGKKRTAARALLREKLEFQFAHPDRLSDDRALEEASRLVDEARGAEPSGPRHREATSRLEALVASYSQSVEVPIVSDALTDVTLNRIGRLGKFDRKVVEIRPGRYVLLGTRPGFRDVRVEIVVEPGKTVAPIVVRCQEAI
jgi:hypothetical protein